MYHQTKLWGILVRLLTWILEEFHCHTDKILIGKVQKHQTSKVGGSNYNLFSIHQLILLYSFGNRSFIKNSWHQRYVHKNMNAPSKINSLHYENYLNKCKEVLKTILDSLKLVTRLKRRIEVIKNEIKASWRGHFLSYLQTEHALACRPAHSGPLM